MIFAAMQDRTRLGVGGAPLGNLFRTVNDADAQALIAHAWRDGCRTFDTAPHYGNGLSEHRIGTALRPLPRGDLVLSSKVGRLLEPDAAAPAEQNSYVGRCCRSASAGTIPPPACGAASRTACSA